MPSAARTAVAGTVGDSPHWYDACHDAGRRIVASESLDRTPGKMSPRNFPVDSGLNSA
jgi:hypothetical protein